MTESIIVRVFLVIYALVAISAALLLWKNSAAPDALKNTGIIIASILPVLIAILPYLISEKQSKEFHYALFYDSAEKEIVEGDEFNAYASSYMHMFTNLSRIPDVLKANNFADFMGNKGLDIIEKGILEILSLNFMRVWDIILSESVGPYYTSARSVKKSETKSTFITIGELRKIFSHNKLISTEGILSVDAFVLPPDTTITPSQKDNTRFIIIKNPIATIDIEIFSPSGGVAQQGIWGVLKPDPQNMNRYYSIEYLVKLTMRGSGFNRYSPSFVDYKGWFFNICNILSKYDWEKIDRQIERNEIRKAVSESLKKQENGVINP